MPDFRGCAAAGVIEIGDNRVDSIDVKHKAQSINLESKKAAQAAFFDEYVSEIIGEADSIFVLYSLCFML